MITGASKIQQVNSRSPICCQRYTVKDNQSMQMPGDDGSQVTTDEWYYEEGGQPQGPISEKALAEMLAQGKLSNWTMVRRGDGPRVAASIAVQFYHNSDQACSARAMGGISSDGHPRIGQPTAQQPPPPPDARTTTATSLSATSRTQRVPTVVGIYGMIIIVESFIGMAFAAVATAHFIGDSLGGGRGLLDAAIVLSLGALLGVLLVGVCVVWFRLGSGLVAGERQAVYGICLLGALSAMLVLFGWAGGQAGVRAVAGLSAVVVWHVPPSVSAFRHWNVLVDDNSCVAYAV